MNENVRDALVKECESLGYDVDEYGIHEMLCDADTIYEECVDSHRHWDDYRYVVEIGGMFIGYVDEYATGDMAGDLGFEFDTNTICEMCPTEVTTIVYKPKEMD
jgi:hypothetical protein